MDFWRAVGILNNRKWLIILSVIAATGLTWGATRLIGARWQSEVKLMALNASASATPTGKADADPNATDKQAGSQRDVDKKQLTQIEAVATSRKVITKALDSLPAQNRFRVDVSQIEVKSGGLGLYLLHYTDSSASRSMVFTNSLANAFIAEFKRMRTDEAQQQVDRLDSQIEQASAKLKSAQQTLARYQASRNLLGTRPDTEIEGATRRFQDVTQHRDDVNQKLADAQAQLRAKQREIVSLPPRITVPGKPAPDPLIADYRKQLAEAENKVNELQQRYSPEYPALRKAIQDRDRYAKLLDNEMKTGSRAPDETIVNPAREQMSREIRQLRADVDGYSAQLGAMAASVSQAESDVNRFKGVNSPLMTYVADVSRYTDIVNSLQARKTAADIALDQAQGSQQPIVIAADVSEDFNPPVNTSQGRTLKLLILAFLGALVGTSSIVIALDSVDRRVKSVSQANVMLPARIVAAIPQPMGEVSYARLARATEIAPSSLHSEAYRFLGLQLLSPRGPRVRSLMVLSAKAEQGSTTTVTNLAITLAQAGKKVILVDANVRTAELHTVFEMPNQFGFTDLLKSPSTENLDKALRPTAVENLQVITSGPLTDNAWQLFRSDNLLELSRKLHERADFVLFDTPSALIFTDALNLAPVVDAAYLCVRALEPLTGAEQRVVELLEQSNVQVLGSVLNDVPAAVVEGYHNYQHYYGGPAAGVAAISGRGDGGSMRPLIDVPPPDNGGHKNGSA